jgi:branched-chain amino acid transport system permease protein
VSAAIAPAIPARTGRPISRHLWAIAAGAILAGLVPFAVGETFVLYIATLVALNAIGAMSCHLIMRLGQLTLGHAAFMGLGGYASALLVMNHGVNWWLAMLAGAALAGLAGLIVGPIVLRLKGVYFVLFTFTFGEFAKQVFVDAIPVTNGSEGISAIPFPPGFETGTKFYYLTLAFALVIGCFCGRLLKSQFGDAVDAIRESESLARSNGVPVFKVKVTIFALACALVAVQGALGASMVHYISPLSYNFPESLKFVVINIIGGLNSIWGPVLGSIFIVALPELLRSWVDYQWVFYGFVLIVLMKYLPGGLFDLGVLVRRAAHKSGARS